MSSPTTPITDPVRPFAGTTAVPETAGPATFARQLASSESSEGIDITQDGPPPEVLDQMARADAINSRLREQGREISFALSPDGCRLEIELRDTSGNVLRRLSAAEAADIAAGKTVI